MFTEVCHSLWKAAVIAVVLSLALTSTDAISEYTSK